MDTTGAVCNWGGHHARELAVNPNFDKLRARLRTEVTVFDIEPAESADEDTPDAAVASCPTYHHQCRFSSGEECSLAECICDTAAVEATPAPLSIDQLIARLRALKDEEMLRQYHTGLDSATPRLIRLATAITALHQIDNTGRMK